MTQTNPTKIGNVQEVRGSTIKVSLDQDLAGVSPIYKGKIREVGQIGSLIRIPKGLVDLIATVSEVGVSQDSDEKQSQFEKNEYWWLEIDLIGQIERGSENFQRGVGSYPEIDDPVHFTTSEELESIFPSPNGKRIQLGYLSTDTDVPITVNADDFVVKHSAVVGSTGSGKTSTVATILQNLADQGWENSDIILIDTHGEYKAAFDEIASVLSVLPDEEGQLRVPYWALPPETILKIFVGGNGGGASFQTRFTELVTNYRREFVKEADWLEGIDPSGVSAETPIPFDIREVWHDLDFENKETREESDDPDTAEVVTEGDAEELQPTEFEPYGTGGSPPHQGPKFNVYRTSPDRLRLGLLDPRLQFFLEPMSDPAGEDPLIGVMEDWLGREKSISVLDFSGVPDRAAEAAVGVILEFIFEVAVRSGDDERSIGRQSPILIVLEEAHRYLGGDTIDLTHNSANRIAREGRKYGVGLLSVTQRPTELPPTTLAQCGTIISLRLTNSDDQNVIRAALPDTISGLSEVLPSLRTHEAIISGEAVKLPVRAFIDEPYPWPKSEDPTLAQWRTEPEISAVEEVLNDWRDTYN